jgi:Fe(3+) dicitrate transport protein
MMSVQSFWHAAGAFACLLVTAPARAHESGPETDAAPAEDIAILVVGVAPTEEPPAVDGAVIYAGKRASVTDLSQMPVIEGQGARQAFSEMPGLLISEVSNGAWQSISFRGLGEPHESWNTLILQDGLPVSPDLYSYPAAYYTPPLDTIARVEFLRGGAGLIYGPLPGGVINFVSQAPSSEEPFPTRLKLTAGADGQRALLAQAGRSAGAWTAWGHARAARGDGPRRANADHRQDSASLRLTLAPAPEGSRALTIKAGLDMFDAGYGEPGGLSRALFETDRRASTTLFDRLEISRTAGFAQLNLTAGDWRIEAKSFASYYERASFRQAGGAFGQATPTANVAVRQIQEFDGQGVDLRVRRDVSIGGFQHVWTFGALAYRSDAPVRVDKGNGPQDVQGLAGALTRAQRHGVTRAVFSEALLNFGRLRIAPGLRVERLDQSVRESLDLAIGSLVGGPPGGPNGPLGARSQTQDVTLWGLAATHDFGDNVQLLVNASRGFKPKLFNDGVTFASGVDSAGVFQSSYAHSYEAGLRWAPAPWARFETAAFFAGLEDQVGMLGGPLPATAGFGAIGPGGARRQNVGAMENRGVDLALAVDLIGPRGAGLGAPFARSGARPSARLGGTLTLNANLQLLDARFTQGPAEGFTPQYAPQTLLRANLAYQDPAGRKAALFVTSVSTQNGVDNGRPEFQIPAYVVADATVEWPLSGSVTLAAGVNNLFDRSYIGRVRPGGGGGVDPGAPRNGYVSLSVRR